MQGIYSIHIRDPSSAAWTEIGYAVYIYIPVVGTVAPHMGKAVDEEGRVEQPYVAYDDRVNGDVPALVPAVDRYQSRDDEGQRQHDRLVVPARISQCMNDREITYDMAGF